MHVDRSHCAAGNEFMALAHVHGRLHAGARLYRLIHYLPGWTPAGPAINKLRPNPFWSRLRHHESRNPTRKEGCKLSIGPLENEMFLRKLTTFITLIFSLGVGSASAL